MGFGFYPRKWMAIDWPKQPSIGNIEAEVFDPATWKTEYPNPAFQQLDAADAFWAASIISRFTDTMIRAVVEEARLSNPAGGRAPRRHHHQAPRQDRAVGRHGDQSRRSLHDRDGPGAGAGLRQHRRPARPRRRRHPIYRPLVAVRQQGGGSRWASTHRSTPNDDARRRFQPASGVHRMRPASGMPSRQSRR